MLVEQVRLSPTASQTLRQSTTNQQQLTTEAGSHGFTRRIKDNKDNIGDKGYYVCIHMCITVYVYIVERGKTNRFGVFSHIAAILDFFLHIVHRRFFVAEIQRRIVLKFQIFRIISFEDIIVQSWSGHNLNFAENAGQVGPVELRR